MKRFLIVALALMLCIACLASCGNNNKEETKNTEKTTNEIPEDYELLSGKNFVRKDGAMLTFYSDGTASYEIINGMGDKFFYLYDVDMVVDGCFADLTLTIIDEKTTGVSDRIEDVEYATLLVDEDTIVFYGETYYLTNK